MVHGSPEFGVGFRRQVRDVADFFFGDDEAVTRLNRADIHKRQVILILPDFMAWNVTGNDF